MWEDSKDVLFFRTVCISKTLKSKSKRTLTALCKIYYLSILIWTFCIHWQLKYKLFDGWTTESCCKKIQKYGPLISKWTWKIRRVLNIFPKETVIFDVLLFVQWIAYKYMYIHIYAYMNRWTVTNICFSISVGVSNIWNLKLSANTTGSHNLPLFGNMITV